MKYPPRDSVGEVSLSWFGETLWKHTPLYAELIVLAICLRLIGLVEPFIFQVIIDKVLPFQREATLTVVMAIFASVTVFQIGFGILSGYLGIIASNRITLELGGRIFDHLFKLPFAYFRRWNVGEILTRLSETDTIRNFLVGTTTGVLLDLLFVVVYLAVIFTLSDTLAWLIVAALPIQAIVYFVFGPFLRVRLRKQFDASASHQSRMVEAITGIAAIKALSAEHQVVKGVTGTLADILATRQRVGRLDIASGQLVFVVERGLTILIFLVGSKLVFAGDLTLGQLVAFYLISEKVAGPISNFSALWERWQNIRVSRQRLGDILNTSTEPFAVLPKLPTHAVPHLKFSNVTFSYVADIPIIRNLNFEARPCTLSLIIGPSGIGKSTFGRLAAGIETADAGSVTLDGHVLSEHDPHDVRATIAYVPQEPYLFEGSLRDNLLLACQEASEEEIRAALTGAVASEFVARLPDGILTRVGERGMALSGGQRQRLALARALITRPKVLVLDEPTSSVDEATQMRFAQQITRLKADMTIVLITHRRDIFTGVDQVIDFEAL